MFDQELIKHALDEYLNLCIRVDEYEEYPYKILQPYDNTTIGNRNEIQWLKDKNFNFKIEINLELDKPGHIYYFKDEQHALMFALYCSGA